jgi:putative PIN family toxin of toxin-antitoxin system
VDRVTADTNVLVSGLNYRGPSHRFLELAEEEVFRLQISEPILNEMSRILQERFHWPLAQAEAARELLSAMAQHVTPHLELDVVKEDPDDNRILECAQASHSDYVVTGDKDLLRLGQYAGTRILKPAEFLVLTKPHAPRTPLL